LEALVKILSALAHQLIVFADVGLLHFLPDQFAVFGYFGDTVIETFWVVQQIEDLIGGFFAFALAEQVAYLTHSVFQSVVIEDHFLVGQNFFAEFLFEFQGLIILLDLLNQFDLAVHGLDGLNNPIQVAIDAAHGIF
jgi:ABC-type Co2+ transport system permease subunit